VKKRGLSNVIYFVLIILVGIGLLLLIWTFIVNVLNLSGEKAELQTKLLLENMKIKNIDIDSATGNVKIVIEKGPTKETTVDSNTQELINMQATPIDIISTVDLSGSMLGCWNMPDTACCTNTLEGNIYYPTPGQTNPNACDSWIPTSENLNACVNICHGTLIDRISPLKQANKQFLDIFFSGSTENRFGIVAFAHDYIPGYSYPLTKNKEDLTGIIEIWLTDYGTCACCGINEATNRLTSEKKKYIILMSDGEPTTACPGTVEDLDKDGLANTPKDHAIYAAQKAREKGIIINAIGLEVNEEGRNVLKNISSIGGGQYRDGSIDNLVDIYEEVASEITSVQTAPVLKIDYIKIVFYNDSTTYVENIFDVPKVSFETKIYETLLLNKITNITKIEIYPVILDSNGKEFVGSLWDEYRTR